MARKKATDDGSALPVEVVAIDSLRPHPRNYKAHPEDQVAHLVESIEENGVYRNVVVAKDGTILAGHGVVLAAKAMGKSSVPVVRLPIESDSPRALKVMAADNEIAHLGEVDDRALSELLKQIKDEDEVGLFGTGYDEAMLANLVMVTRPAGEIADIDEAAEWAGAGMPEYERNDEVDRIKVNFSDAAARESFFAKLGISVHDGKKSIWWPPRDGPVEPMWTSGRFEE